MIIAPAPRPLTGVVPVLSSKMSAIVGCRIFREDLVPCRLPARLDYVAVAWDNPIPFSGKEWRKLLLCKTVTLAYPVITHSCLLPKTPLIRRLCTMPPGEREPAIKLNHDGIPPAREYCSLAGRLNIKSASSRVPLG